MSRLNKRVYEHIERWRNRPIETRFPYVYLDGLFMKMSFGDGVHHVAVLVAIGVDDDGFREVLGVCQGGKEDKESWLSFLRHLKERGLTDPELCISDACLGSVKRSGRCTRRDQVAAVHRALLPQRQHPGAPHEGARGDGDDESHSRPGESL